jgi:adenine deaminase
MFKISGYIVDVFKRSLEKGVVCVEDGKIVDVLPAQEVEMQFIMPGFVDAHIHIESSMMLPSEFARYSLPHGTVACVSDPHEIANVCGVAGVDYMIDNASHSPLKFYFGAPSCVPATAFETSGAEIDEVGVEHLLERDDIHFLSEMMNFPGVIYDDQKVKHKLNAAHKLEKPIDGHAPMLTGSDLEKYALAGISTDHESMSIEEAEAKIALGMNVLIREGSAAKNFDVLLPLLDKYPERIMFCSDDKHPDDLLKNGHIDTLARRALANGYDLFDVMRACSLNPVAHYKLDVGLLQVGDSADFVVVDSLRDFHIKSTYIKGEKVAENGEVTFPRFEPTELINQFSAEKLKVHQLRVPAREGKLKVIEVEDGQLTTKCVLTDPFVVDGNVVSDIDNDVLKLVVYNRYQPSKPAIGFIKNFGITQGSLASTVAHDSHNIVAVGASDEELVSAINHIISSRGGILACDGVRVRLLSLPVAGLMSEKVGAEIAHQYEAIDAMAKELGSKLKAPFMTLAFMSLLVIPELKLSDRGLFDGLKFEFVDLIG